MRRMVFIGTALLLLTVLLITAGCGKTSPTTEQTLKIGAPLALTGWWNAAYDNSILRMTEASVEMINEDGGVKVNGQRYMIELVAEDTQSDFDGVSAATNRLIYEKGCKFLVGPSGFFVPAATPVSEPAKVMTIVGWHVCLPGEVDASTLYTFGTSQGSLPKDIAIIKSMRKDYPNMKKIALATPDDGAIPFLIPKVESYLTQYGFTVVGDIIDFPNEMEDFSPIVAKILALDGVESVFIERCPPPAIGAIVKGLREGGNNVPVFSGSPVATAEIAMMAGATATEGVRTAIDTTNDPDMPAVMEKMAKRVTDKYGADFPLSYQCAVGVYLFRDVIEAANSFDPTVVKTKLESMNKVDTIYGTGVVCGEQSFGIKHIIAHPLPVQIFQGGKPVPGGWYEVGAIP
jgi:ABC-type branched-subunit amino acid transport system substrate-binding protein